jgi:dolichol-phosphate mannosyltransferase
MSSPFTSTSQLDRLLPVSTGDLIVPHHSPAVFFSLVVPTYQESQNIESLVARLTQLLDQLLPHDYELLIVDDDSPDRTWEIALALTAQYPQLRVMRRQERGLATAVVRGWQAAEGAVLGVIDGDLQHPPEVLAQLLAAIRQGSDLAVASRAVAGGGVSDWSLKRRILSRGAQLLGLVVLPQVIGRVSDPMSGYFLVKRGAIAAQRLNPKGYKILIEVVGRGHIAQISEVGYVFRERQEGESKVTWRQYQDYLHHLLRLRLSTGRVGQIRHAFPWGRLIRFGIVGLSGLGVDMGMLHVAYGTLGLGLTRSAIFAGELAILNNFLWNDIWTFRDLSRQQRGMRLRIKRLLKFNIVCLMGLILKVLLLNLLFNGLHLNAYAANLLAIVSVTVWNFWINLKLSWRVTEV